MPALRFYRGAPGGTTENQENLQDNRCSDRDSNHAFPKYTSDSSGTGQYKVNIDGFFRAVMNKKLGDFEELSDRYLLQR